MRHPSLLTVVARALTAGDQDAASTIRRVKVTIGKRGVPGATGIPGPLGIPNLVRRYWATFAGKTRPRLRDVKAFLAQDPAFAHIPSEPGAPRAKSPQIRHWLTAPQQMQPVPAARNWPVPAIASIGELADWLRVSAEELAWFADAHGLNRKAGPGPLHHYSYRLVAKRSGDYRLIEAPKQHLKLLQRQILTEILGKIPAHPAAHGFVHGRSIQTFASPHAGHSVVLRMDLRDFFPSIRFARVQAFFRTAGYPDAVASALAGICTNAVPNAVFHPFWLDVEQTFQIRQLYGTRHLPQGAPTSPSLANFCAYRLDCRLNGLAASAGAAYTRYADDLAFSGDDSFARHAESFAAHAGAILLDEGFAPHTRKTRIMRQSVRQQLAGMVVNQRLNIARPEFDLLKAILTNCLRHGPASQNREGRADFRAHLAGRVGFVETVNAAKGAKLREILNRIVW